MRALLGCGLDEGLIVVTAHLSTKKGHRSLLHALQILARGGTRFRCLCLGEGPELRPLQMQADRLGIGEVVQFLGFREDARRIVREADLVVLPSVRGEGLPLSLLEAAAMGKPAVATRLAGLPEIVVDDKTGYVVQPGDAEALADRLSRLLSDRALRERMGQAARQRVEELFTREHRVRAVEQVYLKALAPSHARHATPAGELHPDDP
jgi:glycosyltransferase involved in cell wall biosynthesis